MTIVRSLRGYLAPTNNQSLMPITLRAKSNINQTLKGLWGYIGRLVGEWSWFQEEGLGRFGGKR
jgi:hypothetical protein